VTENIENLRTIVLRPQDCSEKMKEKFVQLVAAGGEAEEHRVRYSLPYSEVLIFTGFGNTIIGVGALLRPKTSYIQHLFECAGEPQMSNPYSIESCWLSVSEAYRGKGVWRHNNSAKLDYIGDRPYHTIRRVANKSVADLSKEQEYVHVGKDFFSPISKHKLRLMAANHDPVFDPSKKLRYS